ncbi:hypothetical protein HDU79_007993 [Rhizoclosmatium sp. JEL0117]|nr:hypothetical protein HDU79_007993 [Rhizoclosmatium sp. JEL0117]
MPERTWVEWLFGADPGLTAQYAQKAKDMLNAMEGTKKILLMEVCYGNPTNAMSVLAAVEAANASGNQSTQPFSHNLRRFIDPKWNVVLYVLKTSREPAGCFKFNFESRQFVDLGVVKLETDREFQLYLSRAGKLTNVYNKRGFDCWCVAGNSELKGNTIEFW